MKISFLSLAQQMSPPRTYERHSFMEDLALTTPRT